MLVRTTRAVVYLRNLEKATMSGSPEEYSRAAHVKKVIGKLQLEALWVEPGRVRQDTADQIKDQYRKYKQMRIYEELRPESIISHYFNNAYIPACTDYLDLICPELKRSLYINYRLGILTIRDYLASTRRLVAGLEYCDCSL
ncbi:hypothetical protein NDU88_004181 [Pleurodeles waltl]|uniref:Uncharacterized protein n=1 Tax=Pleurodeles waltl TaxID=8319 RepID=A0AAV7KWY7_PLEWA|nr:hypothetical protein NDU88_004181 [Pleurodeles waltl]